MDPSKQRQQPQLLSNSKGGSRKGVWNAFPTRHKALEGSHCAAASTTLETHLACIKPEEKEQQQQQQQQQLQLQR
uniref:Uncharacterized protein n=1 Tax=Melanopsichium pennsylvanicum 4 TaxID=1398559 RepID=A0A077QVS8_9BASI|nr:uncharacterized protein BN887_06158 [Melanopsichium pennsylvanicum 4]